MGREACSWVGRSKTVSPIGAGTLEHSTAAALSAALQPVDGVVGSGHRHTAGPQVCCGVRVTWVHPLPLYSVRHQSPLRGFRKHCSQLPPQFWLKWPENKVESSSSEAFSSVAGSRILGFWRTPEERVDQVPFPACSPVGITGSLCGYGGGLEVTVWEEGLGPPFQL